MITFNTQAAALAQPRDQRAGELLVRFVVNGARSYEWLQAIDVNELAVYDDPSLDWEVVVER